MEAEYLVVEQNLFVDEIAKWKLGPVVEVVYHEYKTFGSSGINFVPNRNIFDKELNTIKSRVFENNVIDINDREKMEQIIKKYIDADPFRLVRATHEHTPWKDDEERIIKGTQGIYYDKTELKKFFQNNKNLLEIVYERI